MSTKPTNPSAAGQPAAASDAKPPAYEPGSPAGGVVRTSRSSVPGGDADVIGPLPATPSGPPRAYGGAQGPASRPGFDPYAPVGRPPAAGGGGPISRPGFDPGAARPVGAPISRPGHDPGAPRPQAAPASRPGYDPGEAGRPQVGSISASPPARTGVPISRPLVDPAAARPITIQATPSAYDPFGRAPPRAITQPGHDPGAAVAPAGSPATHPYHDPAGPGARVPQPQGRVVVIGGVRTVVGGPAQFRSESSAAPARPASAPGRDLFAAAPARPASAPGRDPFAQAAPGRPASAPGRDPFAPATPARDPYEPFSPSPRSVARAPIGQPRPPSAQVAAAAQASVAVSAPFPTTGHGASPLADSLARAATSGPVAAAPARPDVAAHDSDFVQAAAEMAFSPPLSPTEAQEFAAALRRARVAPGKPIVQQGQPADQAAVFVDGVAWLEYTAAGRPAMTFGAPRRGDILGDGAVSGGGYHGCSAIATTECLVFTLSAGKVAELRQRVPSLAAKLRAAVIAQQARK